MNFHPVSRGKLFFFFLQLDNVDLYSLFFAVVYSCVRKKVGKEGRSLNSLENIFSLLWTKWVRAQEFEKCSHCFKTNRRIHKVAYGPRHVVCNQVFHTENICSLKYCMDGGLLYWKLMGLWTHTVKHYKMCIHLCISEWIRHMILQGISHINLLTERIFGKKKKNKKPRIWQQISIESMAPPKNQNGDLLRGRNSSQCLIKLNKDKSL